MKNKRSNSNTSSGFKVPKPYFETFDALLLERLKFDGRLENRQNPGFKVPQEYFESFDGKLDQALSSKCDVKVIRLYTWKKVVYIAGIAASILLMVGLFNSYNNQPTFGTLDTAVIENFIVEEDFNNEDIASLLIEDLTLDNFMDSQLIDSNLEDYILDNTLVEDYILDNILVEDYFNE